MKRLLIPASVCALVLAVGCARRKTVVVRHTPRGATVVHVRHAPPPAPRVRAVKVRSPGRDYVWVKGHWVWRNDRYVWVKGHWVKPPRRGVVWVPGHYDARRGVWVRGHWT